VCETGHGYHSKHPARVRSRHPEVRDCINIDDDDDDSKHAA
jgi:hypothetical protein